MRNATWAMACVLLVVGPVVAAEPPAGPASAEGVAAMWGRMAKAHAAGAAKPASVKLAAFTVIEQGNAALVGLDVSAQLHIGPRITFHTVHCAVKHKTAWTLVTMLPANLGLRVGLPEWGENGRRPSLFPSVSAEAIP